MVFEDAEREQLGGLNLGSVRELNGQRVQAVAFTSGLIPFGPSYAFTSFRKARELLRVENYRVSYVLVKVQPGASVPAVVADLRRQLPDDRVMTVKEAERRALTYIVRNTSIGTSTRFGVLVGFIVVALTLFSAVVDRTKDFGTLSRPSARRKATSPGSSSPRPSTWPWWAGSSARPWWRW